MLSINDDIKVLAFSFYPVTSSMNTRLATSSLIQERKAIQLRFETKLSIKTCNCLTFYICGEKKLHFVTGMLNRFPIKYEYSFT